MNRKSVKNQPGGVSETVESQVIDTEDLSPQSAEVQKPQVQSAPASSVRKKRIPVGTQNLLNVPKRPGYVRRWVNDTEGRLTNFKAAWWEPVMTKDVDLGGLTQKAGADSQMGTPVSKQVGHGVKAYLMEIKEEYYKEDQAEKMKSVKRKEATMFKTDKKDGQYGEVSVKNT